MCNISCGMAYRIRVRVSAMYYCGRIVSKSILEVLQNRGVCRVVVEVVSLLRVLRNVK